MISVPICSLLMFESNHPLVLSVTRGGRTVGAIVAVYHIV